MGLVKWQARKTKKSHELMNVFQLQQEHQGYTQIYPLVFI